MSRVQDERITHIRGGDEGPGPVVYWMSRDQRAADNWALVRAEDLARERGRPLVVLFALAPTYPDAVRRVYDFMLDGLEEMEQRLRTRGAPMMVVVGDPAETVPRAIARMKPAVVVTDFDPLRIKRRWIDAVADAIRYPMEEVDAHNIVPCRHVSTKVEFGAYTIRPKIHRLLDRFLIDYPRASRTRLPEMNDPPPPVNWWKVRAAVRADVSLPAIDGSSPGAKAAKRRLTSFLKRRIGRYAETSNDPNADTRSMLSPYLHFGQLSAQRIAIDTLDAENVDVEQRDSFLEELIVRRELSDNFCLYQEAYDRVDGFPEWARKTLDAHRSDAREYVYSYDEFDAAATHDPLWNAAQRQMVASGYMHGYLRMYWAKKILEWTPSPEIALDIALRLNNRYQLDGRDPNGYAGVAWSIGGVHDRAWPERPILGKVRYMNFAGAKRKFDVAAFMRKWGES